MDVLFPMALPLMLNDKVIKALVDSKADKSRQQIHGMTVTLQRLYLLASVFELSALASRLDLISRKLDGFI